MCEFRKSGLTVIAAHTAFSYTAKRHLTGSKMNQCVVDAATAKPAHLQNRFLHLFVFRKAVQGKRFGALIDPGECILKFFIRQYWQDGTKNLLLHGRIFPFYVIQHSRFDPQIFPVKISTTDHFILIYQTKQTVKMLFVNDLSIL